MRLLVPVAGAAVLALALWHRPNHDAVAEPPRAERLAPPAVVPSPVPVNAAGEREVIGLLRLGLTHPGVTETEREELRRQIHFFESRLTDR